MMKINHHPEFYYNSYSRCEVLLRSVYARSSAYSISFISLRRSAVQRIIQEALLPALGNITADTPK
jgi:hypothetical protein